MSPGAPVGVVLSGTGGVWRVRRDDDGTVVEASLRGRLKKQDYGRRSGGAIRRDTVAAGESVVKGVLLLNSATPMWESISASKDRSLWSIFSRQPCRKI